MTSNIVLRRLLAVHEALVAAALPHAFGGAIALAFHVGEPRATSDIDVNITADPLHAEQVLAVLPTPLGWGPADVSRCASDGQVRLWWRAEPFDTPLDIFLPQHPRLHELVVRRAEQVPLLGQSIPILTATDLLTFKVWFGRRKDWADVEAMLRYGKADWQETVEWIIELLGPDDDRLDTLRQIVAEVGSEG